MGDSNREQANEELRQRMNAELREYVHCKPNCSCRAALTPPANPTPARQLRECQVCGEQTTMSNATEEWEARHRHGAPADPTLVGKPEIR